MSKDVTVFVYNVPVFVTIRDGRVVAVKVDDTASIDDPFLIDSENNPEKLQAALAIAEDSQADWPTWTIGAF